MPRPHYGTTLLRTATHRAFPQLADLRLKHSRIRSDPTIPKAAWRPWKACKTLRVSHPSHSRVPATRLEMFRVENPAGFQHSTGAPLRFVIYTDSKQVSRGNAAGSLMRSEDNAPARHRPAHRGGRFTAYPFPASSAGAGAGSREKHQSLHKAAQSDKRVRSGRRGLVRGLCPLTRYRSPAHLGAT